MRHFPDELDASPELDPVGVLVVDDNAQQVHVVRGVPLAERHAGLGLQRLGRLQVAVVPQVARRQD
jgi:hypothetical protein